MSIMFNSVNNCLTMERSLRSLPTYMYHVWLIALRWELIGNKLLNNLNQSSTLILVIGPGVCLVKPDLIVLIIIVQPLKISLLIVK